MSATSSVVPPVVAPPRLTGHATNPRTGRALPLPQLQSPRQRSTVYGLARLDCHGRIADHLVVRTLGWGAGTRLDMREHAGLVLVSAADQGVFTVTSQGHVRLPAMVRRRCGLATGDRVLLSAEPADGLLFVHPPAALDAMVAWWHAGVLGGDPA
jgi:hypothetical protein